MRYFMTALWKRATSFETKKMNPWVALRNSLGMVFALTGGFLLGRPSLGAVVAIGALVVSYSDGTDPYRQRFRRMFGSSLLCSFAVFLGAFSMRNYFFATVLASAWGFAAGLAVALGSTVADLGLFSLVMFVIFASEAVPAERAALFAALTFAGGVSQTALALVFWPVHRYQPERRELGLLFLEFSDFSRAAASRDFRSSESPFATAQLLRARETLASFQEGDLEAERYRALLNQAERIRLRLVALPRLLRDHEGEIPVFLEKASRLLELTGRILISGDSDASGEEARSLLTELDALILRSEDRSVLPQFESLAGQLRACIDLAGRTTPAGNDEFLRREAKKPWRLRMTGVAATLRANLSLDSAACRHAIRLAVGIAFGEVLGRALGWPRSYWLPMTIALVLKPDYAATLSRGFERIAGTLLGLLLSTALFYFFGSAGIPTQIAWAGAFMFALRWAGIANYTVFAISVSGLVVVLLALSGVNPSEAIVARANHTLLGGAIALLAYAIWPTWEKKRISEFLAGLIDSYRVYFHSVIEAGLQGSPERIEALGRDRLASRTARSNFEAALARFEAEPGTNADDRAFMKSARTSLNRFAHAMMAIEAGGAFGLTPEGTAGLRNFTEQVERTLLVLAGALRGNKMGPEDFPDPRAAQVAFARLESANSPLLSETDRLTNSLNTLFERVLERVQATFASSVVPE